MDELQKPVFNDDHAKTAIDGIQDGREHANIGLGSRYDESIDVLFREKGLKGACEKSGIARLVDNCRRRDKTRERRNNIKSARRQPRLRRAIPAREVTLPATGSVVCRNGCDEAGKYRARRIVRDETAMPGTTRSIQGVGQMPAEEKIFCMSMLRCTACEIVSQERATTIVDWPKPGTLLIGRAAPLNAPNEPPS